MHGHWALAPTLLDGGARNRDRARSGGERLPSAAFPDGRRHVVRAVDVYELDVRAVRKALVRLDRRPEPQELVAVGRVEDDCVRVANRDWDQLVLLPVDVQRLLLPHL